MLVIKLQQLVFACLLCLFAVAVFCCCCCCFVLLFFFFFFFFCLLLLCFGFVTFLFGLGLGF